MAKRKESSRGERRRRSRFDVYSTIHDRFNDELLKCNDPQAAMLAQNWIDAKAKFANWLNDPMKKVSRSSMVSGMEQGLRDMLILLGSFPIPARERLIKAFRPILQEEAPDFLSGDAAKLIRIVKRGRLRNESEYYLVRHRLDEIEGHDEHRAETTVLVGLLDSFEAIGSPRS
jgi:hypothetical protein